MRKPEEVHAGAAPTPETDDLPPPYSACITESGPSSAQNATPARDSFEHTVTISPHATPYHPFPATVDAYYRLKLTRTYHLGESSHHKLFAVSNFGGTSKGPDRPCIVLRNGPNDDDAALAVAGEEKGWTPRSLVSVINLPGPVSKGQDAATPATEVLYTSLLSDRTVALRFSIKLGQGREEFEWSRTNKSEMDDFKDVFRLLRLSNHASESQEDHDAKAVAMAGWKRLWSMNKPFSLRFLEGSQAELGDRWAIMAVITALRLWWLDIQGRLSSSAVAAGCR